jgi:hypothetical protein
MTLWQMKKTSLEIYLAQKAETLTVTVEVFLRLLLEVAVRPLLEVAVQLLLEVAVLYQRKLLELEVDSMESLPLHAVETSAQQMTCRLIR